MATRQYIGARYVPKFFENSATGDSTWAANTAYEPLTIVTYNGNSYTSKKAVPSGTGNPAASPAYWASTGIFNAQVETIREELETKETKLTDRNIIIVSDSYGTTDSDFSGVSFFPYFINAATLAGIPSGNIHTIAARGTSLCRTGYLYLDSLITLATTIDDPAKITDIIIAGGYNDTVTYPGGDNYNQTLLQGMTDFTNYARSTFPNAEITFAFIANAKGNSKARLLYNTPELQEACEKCGVKFINDLGSALDYNGGQLSDGIHPSADGQQVLGPHIFNAFMGGNSFRNMSFLGQVGSGFTAGTGFTIGSGFYFYEWNNDGKKGFYIPDMVITFDSAVSLPTFAAPLTLGACSGKYLIVGTATMPGGAEAKNRSTIRRSGLYHNCDFIVNIDTNGNMILSASNSSAQELTQTGFNDNITEIHLRAVNGFWDARTI